LVKFAGQKRTAVTLLLAIAFTVPLAVYRGTSNQVLLKISLTQLFLLLGFIVWSGRVIIKRKDLILRRSPLDGPLLLFFSLSLLSLFNSRYRWAGGPEIYRLITYLLLYGVSVNILWDRRNLSRLVFIWLLSTGLVSLIGLYEHFFKGMSPPRSTFGNANFFAAYLVLLFPLTLTLFISSIFSGSRLSFNKEGRPEGLRRNWLRISFLATLLLVMTLSLFLASSRGAWLGLSIGLVFLGWLFSCLGTGRRRLATRVIPIFLLLLLILTAFFLPRLLEKKFVREELEKGTLGIRVLIWEGTAKMIAAHPLQGSGIGSFQAAYPRYRLPEYFANPHAVDSTAHAHNEFLEIAAETGILGLLAFLWVLSVFFIKGIDIVKREEDRYKQIVVMGLISGAAGLLVTNLVGVNLRFPSSAIFLWLTMGITMSQIPLTDPYGPRRVAGWIIKTSLVFRGAIFGLVLLLVGLVGWQVVAKPFLADMYFQKGINYRKAGDWEKAISEYQKAVELVPSFIRVYYRQGFAYAVIGDIDKAISAYKKVIDLAPDFARVQANIAFLYKEKGERDKAIRAYQRALELNPRDQKSIYYLKEIYGNTGPDSFSGVEINQDTTVKPGKPF